MWEKHWSEQVVKLAVWLGGLVSFEQAAAILEKVGQIEISTSSVWRRMDEWGRRFKMVTEVRQVALMGLPLRGEMVRGERREPSKRMGVAMDGGMVHIREEGWKELKVGCVFDLEVRPTWDKRTQEVVDMAHAVSNSYVAHLGGPEVFGELVWSEACQRGWARAVETQALGDGAVWIWNLVGRHFYDSRQTVDWYHAVSHLALAANLLKGEGTPAAHKWLKEHKTLLYQGHAERIATELSQTREAPRPAANDLSREAGYLRNNQHRMRYLELREEGFAIGSGMVESGCKQHRARFCGPGMRWSRQGIERLLPVRSAIMSDCFDATWQMAYHLPPN